MSNENQYISGEYWKRNRTLHVEDSDWKAAHVHRMIQASQLSPKSVAEVGCGAGEVLRQLQSRLAENVEFSGFEISPRAHAECLSRENTRLRFFNADLTKESTPPFDLLLCLDVFEHVENYIGFLKRLRYKAHWKIFHIPLDLSVQSVTRATPILHARQAAGHLHYFTKETAFAALQDAGYTIAKWDYTPVGLDTRQTGSARLMRLPRRLLFRLNKDLAVRLLGGFSLLVLAR